MNKTTICPICGHKLIKIDDMNYVTSICPNCHTSVFDEEDGNRHVIKYGISKKDGYNISLDIVYKQFLSDQMVISGRLNVNPGEVMCRRIFKTDIYSDPMVNHFFPMFNDFKMQQKYNYFDGYDKYFRMSDNYFRKTFPKFYE